MRPIIILLLLAGVSYGQQLEIGSSLTKRYHYLLIPGENEQQAFVWNNLPQYYFSHGLIMPKVVSKTSYFIIDKDKLEIRQTEAERQLKKQVKKGSFKHFGNGQTRLSSVYENKEGVGLAYFDAEQLSGVKPIWPLPELGSEFTAAEGERYRQVYSDPTGQYFLLQESYYQTIAEAEQLLYEVSDFFLLFDQEGKLIEKKHFIYPSLGRVNEITALRISPAARHGILDSSGNFLFLAGSRLAYLDASDDYDLKSFPIALNQPRLGAQLKEPMLKTMANGDILVALSYTTVKDMEKLPFFGVTPNERSLGIFIQKHRASDKEITAFNLVDFKAEGAELSPQSQSALSEMAAASSIDIQRIESDGSEGHLLLVQELLEKNSIGSTESLPGRSYLLSLNDELQLQWASALPISHESINALLWPLNPLILANETEVYLLAANKLLTNRPKEGASLFTFNKQNGDWQQTDFALPGKLADFNVKAITPNSNSSEQIALVSNSEGTHIIRFKL